MKIILLNAKLRRMSNLNFNIEFQRSYHTLSAVIRLFSGLETSDLMESRSVRGTPYSLSIVSTRRLLQCLYTLGAVACPDNPMVSRYLLNDSMFRASLLKSTSSSIDSRISLTIPTYQYGIYCLEE